MADINIINDRIRAHPNYDTGESDVACQEGTTFFAACASPRVAWDTCQNGEWMRWSLAWSSLGCDRRAYEAFDAAGVHCLMHMSDLFLTMLADELRARIPWREVAKAFGLDPEAP